VVVVLADGAPRLLVVVANVDRGGAVDRGLHPVPVAIVDEAGRCPATHAAEPVLGVIRSVTGTALLKRTCRQCS